MAVYIIRAGDTDAVKIGWAIKPAERMADLQMGHHEKLSIVRLIEGPRSAEYRLHRHFKARRITGEWFRFCEEMLTVNPMEVGSATTGQQFGPPVPAHLKHRMEVARWTELLGHPVPDAAAGRMMYLTNIVLNGGGNDRLLDAVVRWLATYQHPDDVPA